MSEIIRCSNCKHWDTNPTSREVLKLGYCKRIQWHDYRRLGRGKTPEAETTHVEGLDEADLRTAPDFGCVLGEARPVELCDKPSSVHGYICVADRGHDGGCYLVRQDSGDAVIASLRGYADGTIRLGSDPTQFPVARCGCGFPHSADPGQIHFRTQRCTVPPTVVPEGTPQRLALGPFIGESLDADPPPAPKP